MSFSLGLSNCTSTKLRPYRSATCQGCLGAARRACCACARPPSPAAPAGSHAARLATCRRGVRAPGGHREERERGVCSAGLPTLHPQSRQSLRRRLEEPGQLLRDHRRVQPGAGLCRRDGPTLRPRPRECAISCLRADVHVSCPGRDISQFALVHTVVLYSPPSLCLWVQFQFADLPPSYLRLCSQSSPSAPSLGGPADARSCLFFGRQQRGSGGASNRSPATSLQASARGPSASAPSGPSSPSGLSAAALSVSSIKDERVKDILTRTRSAVHAKEKAVPSNAGATELPVEPKRGHGGGVGVSAPAPPRATPGIRSHGWLWRGRRGRVFDS